jgi:hypothetical protein
MICLCSPAVIATDHQRVNVVGAEGQPPFNKAEYAESPERSCPHRRGFKFLVIREDMSLQEIRVISIYRKLGYSNI